MVDQTTETDTVNRNQKIVLVIFAVGVLFIGGYPPWDVECHTTGRSFSSRVEYAPLFAPPYEVRMVQGTSTVGAICESSGINTSTIAATYFGWILLMGVAFILVRVRKAEERIDPD